MKETASRFELLGPRVAVLAALVFPWAAAAQSSPSTRRLTFEQALELADAKSFDLAQARARLAQTETQVATARASLLPTAALQGKYTHNSYPVELTASELSGTALQVGDALVTATNDLYAKTGTTPSADSAQAIAGYQAAKAGILSAGPIIITPMDQLDASGTLTVPLVVPWAWYQLRSANRNVDAGRAGYEVSRAQTLLAVAQAFYLAAGTDEVMTARTHAVALAKKTLDDALAKVELGAANVVESDRAQIAYDRAVQSQTEARAQVDKAYRTLSTALGGETGFVVDPAAPAAPPPASDQDLLATAQRLRPEFLQTHKQIEASDATGDANAARWLPTLSAFGQARAFNYGGFSGTNYALAAGLQLDWSLYDGGARDAARALANAQRDEAQARLSSLQLTIADDIANARRDLDVKHAAVTTAQRAVTLSGQTLERVRAQHDAGTIAQLDLLNAQDTVVSAELTLAQARFDLELAELTLQRQVGTFPQARAR